MGEIRGARHRSAAQPCDDLATKPKIRREARAALDKSAPLVRSDRNGLRQFLRLSPQGRRPAHHDETRRARHARPDRAPVVVRRRSWRARAVARDEEKTYSAYEEMIHIPLVVSNPLLYPEPRETQASTPHLDLLPTLAELAGVPELRRTGPAGAWRPCCAIRRRAWRIPSSSPMTTRSACRLALLAPICARCGRGTGPTRSISASMAAASNELYDLQPIRFN